MRSSEITLLNINVVFTFCSFSSVRTSTCTENHLKMGLKSFWPLVSSSHFAFEGSPPCSSGFWISPPLLSCLSPVYKETNGYGWFLDKKDRKDRNPHPSRSPHLGEGLLHLVHVQPLAHHLTLCHTVCIRSKNSPNNHWKSAMSSSHLLVDPLHWEGLTCGRSVFDSGAFATKEEAIHLTIVGVRPE